MYLCSIFCSKFSYAVVSLMMLHQVLAVPTIDNKSTVLQHIDQHSFSNRSFDTLHNLWKEKWGPFPDDPSDPVTMIYYKYAIGSNGMTASEFETLLNCSFGSSSCNKDYISNSTVSPYSYLIDCQINSALSPEKCDIINKCNNVRELMSIFSQNDQLNETQFRNVLPIVFFQMQSQLCKDQNFQHEEVVINKKPSSSEVWGYGILFVTLISGLSLAGVSVLPLMAKEFYQKLLTVLIGLAVGSLAASSAFHLIPQAFGMINSSGGNHEYLFVSLWILIGIYLFFMIERLLKIIMIAKKQASENFPNSLSSQTFVQDLKKCGRKENCVQDAYRVNPICTKKIMSRRDSNDSNCENSCLNATSNNTSDNSNSFCTANNVELIYASQEQAIKASFGHEQRPVKCHDHEIKFQQGKDSVIKTVAWMIIFGDGFHNFIDGVSIGAAFQQSILTGISISLAVMCEELPHELGDFAVLLNSGMGMKQALFYNFLSATTCYFGMAVGIVIGEFTQNSSYVFALAAGMFLYISLVDMLPEMNETGNQAAAKGLPDVIKVLFLQTFGMALGVGSLFFLAYYQDRITLGS